MWLILSGHGGSPATAPSPGEATPSTRSTEPPVPGAPSEDLVEQLLPDATDECPDPGDAQVYARPYSPPSPVVGPKPSPRVLACPAV